MSKQNAAIIKVLHDVNWTQSPKLTPEQEQMFKQAIDPEEQYLADIEKLFNKNTN